jgi:hypothetical protein
MKTSELSPEEQRKLLKRILSEHRGGGAGKAATERGRNTAAGRTPISEAFYRFEKDPAVLALRPTGGIA